LFTGLLELERNENIDTTTLDFFSPLKSKPREKTNVYRVQRLWTVVTQSLSRMGLRQVIAAAVQSVVSSLDFNTKRNDQECRPLVSFPGPIENLDPSWFNAFERMDFQEFHFRVSSVGKLWIDFECRGWHM
jgi:hypothetical protein